MECMAGTWFRAFSDETAEIVEAATQVGLGLGAAALGVGVALGPARGSAAGLALLIMPGMAGVGWAAWWFRALWFEVRRARALRSAVDGTAVVLSVRPRDTWADEWHLRRFVDVELLVTLPTGPARRLRQRAALTAEELAGLRVGGEVAVQAHPVYPAVRLADPG
jgi:hypothetical protein